jgi:hypothetical protein
MVDSDVTLKKMEALVVHQVGNPHRLHVHAINMPWCGFENQFRQMVTDKTVHPEDENIHINAPVRIPVN